MAALGFSTGLYAMTPTVPGLPLRLLTVLFVPALGEEIPFRGLLVPGREEAGKPWPAIALSTALYVAWHPLEALTFLPQATMFLRPDFLACTAILGLGCALMRWRTGLAVAGGDPARRLRRGLADLAGRSAAVGLREPSPDPLIPANAGTQMEWL
jgi:predicted Abi (CAAX) family protease